MTRFFLLGLVVMVSACSQPYGRQSCKADKDCGSGQFCPTNCAVGIDAGADVVDVSAICQKPCATDDDCKDLALKNPKCVVLQCAGNQKTCTDYPF